MSVQVTPGRVRVALGDGATNEQAKRVYALLQRAGLVVGHRGALQIVGVAEIAAMAGVTPSAISQRRDLPEPLGHPKQGRVWDLADIEPWVRERYGVPDAS